jgi:putative ABC transport system permease protein
VTGAAVAVAGIALTIAGTTGEVPAVTGLGAVATLTGVVVLGPVAARPAAAVLGAPLAARRGMSGVLARRNAMRNPRRTAGTAVSLMIGECRGGLSIDLAAAVTELPEVAAASPIGGAPVRIDGRDTLASTFDPATIGSVVDLGVRDGSGRSTRTTT